MGPWCLRDVSSPFRPGCSFDTLRDLIKRGKITRDTILRGPSTRQYWNFASRTPGVANLLGVCHNCHVTVRSDDFSCAACGAVFSPETDRQHMGLAPVHLLPGQAAPEIIAAASMDQARGAAPPRRSAASEAARPLAPVRARRSRGARAVSVLLALLILLGAAAVGVLRFVLPALHEEASPSRQTAALPPAREAIPARVEPEPAQSAQPKSSTPPAEPAPAEPSTPAPAPPSDPRPELLASLEESSPDFAAIQRRIDDLGAVGALADAAQWSDLLGARRQQARLRSLP
jgi:hypothetical protein